MNDYIEHERRLLQYVIHPEEPQKAVEGCGCILTLGMLDEVIDNTVSVCLIILPPDIYTSILRQVGINSVSFKGIPIIPCVNIPKNEVWFYCIQDKAVRPYKKLINVVA